MSTYTDEVQQQRAQLSRLYEQQESLTENIKGLKQIIATLEYVAGKETEKEEQKLQDIITRAKTPEQSNKGTE
jgi:tRNA C32,U32 (ribose-2'-O)-methylase TrmJ